MLACAIRSTPPRPSAANDSPQLTSAQQNLITNNIRLLHWVSMRIYNRSPFIRARLGSVDEAVSAGSMGMVKAAQLYDKRRGIKFSTYAASCIEKNIIRAAQLATVVHVPVNFHSPSNAKRKERFAAKADAALNCQSLPSGLEVATFDDLPADNEKLIEAVETLPEREKFVIKLRFWSRLTLTAIGEELGMTREGVRQIQLRAITKLRDQLRPD